MHLLEIQNEIKYEVKSCFLLNCSKWSAFKQELISCQWAQKIQINSKGKHLTYLFLF